MKKLSLFLILLFVAEAAFAVDQWSPAIPLSASSVSDYPAQALSNNNALDRLLSYYRAGQVMTYKDAGTITVSSGEVSCTNSSTGAHIFRQNAASVDVTFGDIDTGSESPSTTYYVYANCDASATTNTFKISANATTPTGVTSFRRIGSFYNDSTSSIITISNDNNYYSPAYGAWTSKTVGSTYQALTDGLFTVFGCAGDVRGQAIYVYSDSSSTPTTLRGQSGAGYDEGSGTAITIPVRQGDYYKATFSSSDSCSATSYFVSTN